MPLVQQMPSHVNRSNNQPPLLALLIEDFTGRGASLLRCRRLRARQMEATVASGGSAVRAHAMHECTTGSAQRAVARPMGGRTGPDPGRGRRINLRCARICGGAGTCMHVTYAGSRPGSATHHVSTAGPSAAPIGRLAKHRPLKNPTPRLPADPLHRTAMWLWCVRLCACERLCVIV